MKYARDNYHFLLFKYLVDDSVRKSRWVTPPNIFCWMSSAMQQGIGFERIEDGQNFFDEFIPKSLALGLVPTRSFPDVVFRLRSRNDYPPHD
jgi:hypothetical protein